jgi:hypothetical protein
VWKPLLSRKFDTTRNLIPKPDFDHILGEYTSLADFPCSIFAEDLIAAYPAAKVILSVRDSADAWYKSSGDTVWRYQSREIYTRTLMERFWAAMMKTTDAAQLMAIIIHNTPLREFVIRGKQWYLDHNERIRQLVPPDRLLEFNARQEWRPLCEYLGVEQPKQLFPNANRTDSFLKGVDRLWLAFKVRKTQGWLRVLSVGMVAVSIALCLLRAHEVMYSRIAEPAS